ncbi:MAG: hypothetical protein ACUVUQ_05440 [Thermodesulfovibrionales bacterium]
MNSGILLPIALVAFFIIGIWFVYFMVRAKGIKFKKLDEKTLLLKLPFLGTIETEEPKEYKGVFVKEISEALEKIKFFQNLLDPFLMLEYANNYNLNYIGTEGDNIDGTWSKGRLAYNTLSNGHNGGYNIYLNPNLDREAVSKRLSEQLGLEIEPSELYTFLFLHEIGHTRKAGNECYVTAIVNHSLSGGRRAAKRRRELKNLYIRSEKFADNFAIQELIKIRQKGMN